MIITVGGVRIDINDVVLFSRWKRKERRVLEAGGKRARGWMRDRLTPPPTQRRRSGRRKYPYSHVGNDSGLRNMFYQYTSLRRGVFGSVVVGPRKLRRQTGVIRNRRGTQRIKSAKPAPELQDAGGVARSTFIYQSGLQTQSTFRYKSRPFITNALRPALRKINRAMREIPF